MLAVETGVSKPVQVPFNATEAVMVLTVIQTSEIAAGLDLPLWISQVEACTLQQISQKMRSPVAAWHIMCTFRFRTVDSAGRDAR